MNLNLTESLISLQKEQVAPGITIPTQVNFYFTPSNLKAIINSQKSVKSLSLSPELLRELRYYSLLKKQNTLNYSLVFITYYIHKEQPIAVIKSVISLDGKISQQINRSFFRDIYLLKDLISSHYWLVEQLSDRLHWKYTNKSNLLSLFLSAFFSIVICLILFYLFSFNWLIILFFFIVFFLLLYLLAVSVWQKYLKAFILQQLLFGFFANNTARRKLSWFIMKNFY